MCAQRLRSWPLAACLAPTCCATCLQLLAAQGGRWGCCAAKQEGDGIQRLALPAANGVAAAWCCLWHYWLLLG
jgi:hypothetical protein